ncbi:MAG: efflux RND transporter periplasmic adaptor subunit [Planctomycetota bacterium]|jgi:HlyD family secretion protein
MTVAVSKILRSIAWLGVAPVLCLSAGCERADANASTASAQVPSEISFGGARPAQLYTVGRESITRRILMSAVIRPSDIRIIRNSVGYGEVPPLLLAAGFEREPARLIWLIDEGAEVKKGDLLYELRSDNLRVIEMERQFYLDLVDLALTEWNGKATVARIEGEASMQEAKQDEEFAEYDLDQYTNGTAPVLRQTLVDAVTRTEARLEQARDELIQSEKLFANGYISRTDLESDRLIEEERAMAAVNARSQLNLFEKYTYPRQVLELERAKAMRQSDYNMAQMTAISEISLAERYVTYNKYKKLLRITRLARIKQNIADTKVHAPADGKVIYAKSNGGGRAYYHPPIVEGSNVYFNEQLIHLITSDRKHAEAKLLEMDLSAVRVGQPVEVTVESRPGLVLQGRVESIGYMATQASVYRNPDLRQYKVRVGLDAEDYDLQPGMNALAEVIVGQVDDVVAVPIEAVITGTDPETGQTTHAVAVTGASGVTRQPVTLGIRNAFKVEVVAGLDPGEVVLLNPYGIR